MKRWNFKYFRDQKVVDLWLSWCFASMESIKGQYYLVWIKKKQKIQTKVI